MSVLVPIPKSLFEKARECGIDIVELVINVLAEKLRLDPVNVAYAHLELAERYLNEAKHFLERGDAVQASEKLYKVAEECIKALAEFLRIPEVEKARSLGRWFTWLLDKAARRIAKILNEYHIKSAWDTAYSLHVWGFHEAKLDIDDVKLDIPQIEWLLEYTKQTLRKTTQ